MKKLLLLTGFSFFLISCQQDELLNNDQLQIKQEVFVAEEFDNDTISPNEEKQLRAVVNYDPLLCQLADKDIEVNFINRGDVNEYRYLSIERKKDYVNLHNRDDASGRQRWKLRKGASSSSYYLTASGNSNGFRYLWGQYNSKNTDGWPRMLKNEVGTFTIAPINNTDYYTLSINGGANSASRVDDQTLVMASDGYNTHHLYFIRAGSTNRKSWEIKPIENFVIKDGGSIKYTMQGTDRIDVMPNYIDEVEIINWSSVAQVMTVSYSNRASSTSSHSQKQGVTTSVSQTLNVGVPLIADGKLTTTTTQSNEWSYTNSQTKEDTRSYSFPVSVPAQTKIIVKIIVAQYKANLTYTIDAIGESSGKSLTIRGTWTGVTLGKILYEIKSYTLDGMSKGATKTITETPKSTVYL